MSILERIPEIICPACKSGLEENDDLQCKGCGKIYKVRDGIPNMLGDDMKAFAEEIEVQDRVACEYEQKRYQDPYAKRYHDWWTDKMLAQVSRKGRFLDNGCGNGLLLDKVSSDQIVGLDISREFYVTKFKIKEYQKGDIPLLNVFAKLKIAMELRLIIA